MQFFNYWHHLKMRHIRTEITSMLGRSVTKNSWTYLVILATFHHTSIILQHLSSILQSLQEWDNKNKHVVWLEDIWTINPHVLLNTMLSFHSHSKMSVWCFEHQMPGWNCTTAQTVHQWTRQFETHTENAFESGGKQAKTLLYMPYIYCMLCW